MTCPSGPSETTAPAATAAWTAVSVPHTWNALEVQTGKGYHRGPGWYKTTVDIPELRDGQRAYIRFEAVSAVADVYFNGHHLGTHLGAFNAFAYEITPHARPGKANELVVRADNSWRPDLIPLEGMSVFGGIYRPAHLVIKPATSFSLLDHGSYGVAIDQTSVSAKRATLRVTASIDTGAPAGARTTVALSLRDAAGKTLATTSAPARPARDTPAIVTQEISLNNPRLWQGTDDPYLHTLVVELRDAADGALLDSQEWPVGFRWFKIDPKRGFFLNGKPWKLRGVCRHQDRPDKGWALSDADHAEDLRIIREMGANAVRLVHYPHSDTFHALCDRAGLLVWSELPLMKRLSKEGAPLHPGLLETTRAQLRELIRQRRNFTGIFTWSLSNELRSHDYNACADVLASLRQLAQTEDPCRPTSLATDKSNRILCNATDLLAINFYPGWYDDDIDGMPARLAALNKTGGGRGLAVSEYGAGVNTRHHELGMTRPPKVKGPWHPEEWHAIVHEKNHRAIAMTDCCWGGFAWIMFDFASGRNEGGMAGLNNKGLVSHDRKTRTDAFYFYKANWSGEPVLRITSRRFTERKDPVTEIKVYMLRAALVS
ncbi:MAG: glycoside hydrolase family 2 [Kiritimatiellaeota bacterium]|nr:glycoside hydrolase family 2 [Kiritimatiellota bacterium]